jgi:hypothetical protein
MYSSQHENRVYFIAWLLAIERTTSFVTDVSSCSEDLNAVIQNTFCAGSKSCRTNVGPVFQSYAQETESGGYEVGIIGQSPCAVCFIICVFVLWWRIRLWYGKGCEQGYCVALRTVLAERGNGGMVCDKPKQNELRLPIQCPFYNHESPLKSTDMYEPNTRTLNAHTRYIMIK